MDATERKPRQPRPKWGEPGSKCVRPTEARVFSRGARPVTVTIYPNGLIGLRLKGTRRIEYAEVADLYRQACMARVRAEREAKKAKKKGRRK